MGSILKSSLEPQSDKERRNLSAVVHEMTMNRGLPPPIGFFMDVGGQIPPFLGFRSLKSYATLRIVTSQAGLSN